MGMLETKGKIVCAEGKTKQKTGQEHDINKLVRQYQKTGILPTMRDEHGLFADVCSIGDYQQCRDRVIAANEAFASLPSNIRARFNQNPAVFMDFMSNIDTDEKIKEAVDLGLLVENKKPEIIKEEKSDEKPK